MQFSDFEYDGIALSDMGMTVVSFDGVQDGDITTDSQRSFESISLFGGRYQPFLTSVYEDRLEIEFSIGKNLCNDENDFILSIEEIENLQYWLNRPTPHKFKILDDEEYADVYWEGSFNLQWVKYGERIVGVNLTFISNRPYAQGERIAYIEDLTSSNELVINDISSDEGKIIPDVKLVLKENGNLEFVNTFNGIPTITKINNCKKDEIITISHMMQIYSNLQSHDIYNDFNWVFPSIFNTYDLVTNTFTSNLECECVIAYNPVRKVTFS